MSGQATGCWPVVGATEKKRVLSGIDPPFAERKQRTMEGMMHAVQPFWSGETADEKYEVDEWVFIYRDMT